MAPWNTELKQLSQIKSTIYKLALLLWIVLMRLNSKRQVPLRILSYFLLFTNFFLKIHPILYSRIVFSLILRFTVHWAVSRGPVRATFLTASIPVFGKSSSLSSKDSSIRSHGKASLSHRYRSQYCKYVPVYFS